MNEGKKFEQDFIKSVPEEWFKYRLNDSASSWQGGENARFTPSNICDFIVYNGKLWLLELKSHKGASIPLDCIREKQIDGLFEAWEKGVNTGFIINFRDTEETFFISSCRLFEFTSTAERKSIPIKWCRDYAILIPQAKKISHYRYILEFMEAS